jgi:hypothetical protein
MIRIVLGGGDFADVDADVITFDGSAVVLWAQGTEVGRHRQSRIDEIVLDRRPASEASELTTSGQTSSGPAYQVDEIRKDYPNAYRPWTDDEEELLLSRHAKGRRYLRSFTSSAASRAASSLVSAGWAHSTNRTARPRAGRGDLP